MFWAVSGLFCALLYRVGMNKNYIPLLAALAVSPLVSGCFTTLAMKGMNGPGACPAEITATASANAYILQGLSPGDTVQGLPEPQEKESIALRGGENHVDVWYYRTGHPLCRGLPTGDEPYTMV